LVSVELFDFLVIFSLRNRFFRVLLIYIVNVPEIGVENLVRVLLRQSLVNFRFLDDT